MERAGFRFWNVLTQSFNALFFDPSLWNFLYLVEDSKLISKFSNLSGAEPVANTSTGGSEHRDLFFKNFSNSRT
jgi:hypothetical protein